MRTEYRDGKLVLIKQTEPDLDTKLLIKSYISEIDKYGTLLCKELKDAHIKVWDDITEDAQMNAVKSEAVDILSSKYSYYLKVLGNPKDAATESLKILYNGVLPEGISYFNIYYSILREFSLRILGILREHEIDTTNIVPDHIVGLLQSIYHDGRGGTITIKGNRELYSRLLTMFRLIVIPEYTHNINKYVIYIKGEDDNGKLP
jgi:hypothetical protein